MNDFYNAGSVVHQPFSVLHVDSDMLMRTILKKTIPDKLFRLDSAADGREAFRLLEKNNYAYDIVITEMHMHYANGYEIFNRILRYGPNTTVIVTSNMSFFHIREGLELDRENYFKKPLVVGKLIKRISELLIKGQPSHNEQNNDVLQNESVLSPLVNDDTTFPFFNNNSSVDVAERQLEKTVVEEILQPQTWPLLEDKNELLTELFTYNDQVVVETSPLPHTQHIVPAGPGKRWW